MKDPKPLSRQEENDFRREVDKIRNEKLVDEININQPNKITKLNPKIPSRGIKEKT